MSQSCWAWRNLTLERGWSPISSLAILITRAPFWPADMHTVHVREWRGKALKPVTRPVWPVWLVQTPGRLIAHTQQDFDTISSDIFLSLHFSCARKNLCYQGSPAGTHAETELVVGGNSQRSDAVSFLTCVALEVETKEYNVLLCIVTP